MAIAIAERQKIAAGKSLLQLLAECVQPGWQDSAQNAPAAAVRTG